MFDGIYEMHGGLFFHASVMCFYVIFYLEICRESPCGWTVCMKWWQCKCESSADAELSTGRMNPLVGSGHDFAGFCRVGSGRVDQHVGFLKFFTDYFLVPESIWIFEYYIRIDCFSTIFNLNNN